MFAGYKGDDYEAVMFFGKGRISYEMMYTEFEAILDSFFPLTDYASQQVNAVYVRISPQLKVTAAVFFLISFNDEGRADTTWNVPVQQFADEGKPGPDLGAGPIHLACRSQCPVSWHEKNLWDPDMERSPNDFVLLRDTVARNKLLLKDLGDDAGDDVPTVTSNVQGSGAVAGFTAPPLGNVSEGDKAIAGSLIQFVRMQLVHESADRFAEAENKSNLLLATQKSQFEDAINQLNQENAEHLSEMQQHFEAFKQELVAEQQQNALLRGLIDEQQKLVDQVRSNFEGQLAETKADESSQLNALQQNFNLELEMKVTQAVEEYKQKLAAKDLEIVYRDEKEQALKGELEKLHNERAQLIKEAGEQFLNRLRENQVSFVVYHAGAGTINIDLENIGRYLDSPQGYAAQVCGVSVEVYRDWLKHYNAAACDAVSATKGDVCGKKLKRVDAPAQYVHGRSNRCPLHWAFSGDNQSGAAAAKV